MKPEQDAVYNNKVQRAVKRWKGVLDYTSGSMREIQNEHVYKTTALLMENQYEHCINEANATTGVFGTNGVSSPVAMTNTDGYASGDSRIPKILIPMIRRTFPELISNEICGVQPMAGPVGLAFALRYAYSGDTLSNVDAIGKDGGVRGYNGTNYGGAATLSALPGTGSPELGFQFLDSRFTGTSSGELSGRAEADGGFLFNAADSGVAQLLSAYENTGRIPQIEVKFEKTAVQAGTRRIACSWSTELEQDLKNMQNLDIDGEFTNTMSYELQAEIDREVVMRMIQSAFNAGVGAGISVWSPISADGRWTAERNITFYQRLIVEANRMAARNRRGAANFIIATPRVCAMLEMLPDFKVFEINGTVSTTGVGISKVGVVGSRFTVYRDTRTEVQNYTNYGNVGYGTSNVTPVEYALLGYKGSEYFDTGIIYCPYIPIMIQRAVDPTNFTPRVGMMTRYGIISNIFGSSLYYHIVVVKNLGEAFTPGSVSSFM